MWGCGAKIEIGFITCDHDGFDAKGNLTINNAVQRLQDATSEEALYWTGQQSTHSTLLFIISKQLKEINFITRF